MAYPKTALIVDDESHVRAFVRLLLKELGIDDCQEAADGVSALHLVQQSRPELVMLDVNLPGMSGLQVLAQLQQIDPTIPVIIVTSQSSIATVNEAVRLGASGYLIKHATKPETVQALREVLDSLEEEEKPEGD